MMIADLRQQELSIKTTAFPSFDSKLGLATATNSDWSLHKTHYEGSSISLYPNYEELVIEQ